MNGVIIAELEKLALGYHIHRDKGRAISCRKAIKEIKTLDF